MRTRWHSNKFLNPVHDGAVLPILHPNGYKIAGPTVLARIPHDELEALFRGYGYTPHFVEGDDPETMHQLMAVTLDRVIGQIQRIQRDARVMEMLSEHQCQGWLEGYLLTGRHGFFSCVCAAATTRT